MEPVPPTLNIAPDEKVLLLTHRHWSAIGRSISRGVIVIVIPLVIAGLMKRFMGWDLEVGSLGYTILVGAGGLYVLFLWVLGYGFWLDYWLDFYLITDRRIVEIEQAGLFHRTVSEQPLFRVQDVTSEVHGVAASTLGYGNVYIQSAGEKERFVLEEIPRPEKVARMILDAMPKNIPADLPPVEQKKPPVIPRADL